MNHTIIIAEAGVNHNGNIDLAKRLIDEAKACKADYVKFQSFVTEENISCNAPKAKYQNDTTESSETQFEMLKKLELNFRQTEELKIYADKIGIGFLTTPAEKQNVDLVSRLELDFIKIASESITNYLLLAEIGKLNRPTILSTGMCNMEEISSAMSVLMKYGLQKKNLILLHCNSEYPSPYLDLNLRAIQTLKKHFDVAVGFSDHSEGIEASIAAVALGSEVIEKHFTLNNDMDGPDHSSSLDPEDFGNLVKAIRNVELSLGNGIKAPSNSEKKNIKYMRRSLVARMPIKKGERYSIDNVAAKRPAIGISPMEWEIFEGKPSSRNYETDELIKK